jgi:hypothetical protein
MSIAPLQQSRGVDFPPPMLMKQWTVDEYHHLIELGIFEDDNRFELLEGWIVAKVSRNPPHDVAVDKAQEALRSRLTSTWRIRIQCAITLSDSEPEPDLVVVPGPADRYTSAHPSATEIELVVEVADSSLLEDRRRKTRIYARSGIRLSWIVNLVDRVVEVHTDPTGPSGAPLYRTRRIFTEGESISVTIAGESISVPVSDLLPIKSSPF